MKQIPRLRGRARSFVLLVVVVVIAGGSVFAGRGRLIDVAVAPAPAGTPLPTAVALTTDEDAFYRYVGTRLRALTAESAKLAALGEGRSRNVLELQARANRIDDLSGQIDRYLAATPIPARFEAAVASYRAGIAVMRKGMDATKTAFSRFNWDGVAAGLATFETGNAQVEQGFWLLQQAAGLAPAGTPPPGLAG